MSLKTGRDHLYMAEGQGGVPQLKMTQKHF